MNKFKRFVSLVLVLCMVMAFVPAGVSAAEDTSYAYSIVHVDAGRKYFSPESLKTIIDNAAAAGFNQVELYLSDNQGFRFALDDMTLTTAYGTYDLTACLGDGYSDGSKYPDYTGKYLTQSEMDEIIAYANGKGIDIVPSINAPGHMGAILEEFPGFRYTSGYQTSKSSIDLNNEEAVAFALALTEKYASYFASKGCKYYSVGADEYANDLSTMGFEGMGAAMYTKFVQFLNDAADIITAKGMTPRAFNDGFYYKDYSVSVEPSKAYEIYYWSSGWSGYDVAAASTIAAKGHKLINAHGDYYWVLGNSSWQCSASKAGQFNVNTFQGGTISAPAGAMFCIWCDNASAGSQESVVTGTADVIAAFGTTLPETESLVVSDETADPTEPGLMDDEPTDVSAPDLTVEFWITNNKVTANGSDSVSIAAAGVYGEAGVEIATLVPDRGTMGSTNVAYWKTTRLDSSNKQTTGSGVNKTLAGTDFTYIRYYNDSWAYSADGSTWTNVLSGDQIVAYYLQVTEVTDEITTQVVDWGELYGNSYNDSNYVLVDYAVKYESGERTPNAFPINGTTQKFHCSSDSTNVSYGNVVYDSSTRVYYRNLWSIRAVETSEYEVYMITLTPTSDSATTSLSSGANSEKTNQENFYAGTEKVIWVDNEANLGSFADESLHYTSISGDVTFTVGGEPTIPELEIYNRHGMLVTYYVRAKATEDALTVHYIDATEGANNLEFYSYNIAVKEGTYFNQNIALNTNNPNGDLLNGTVTNYYGRTQTVSADLSTLSQIGAQYLYTEYNCIRVQRSEDGKHVYLYYTFDPTVYFVADFGLPVVITATELSEKLEGVKIEDMSFSGVSYTAYGQIVDNGATITYKPTKVLTGLDYFTLLVTTASEVGGILDEASTKIAFRVYVVPATTVNYEESFAALSTGWTVEGTANAGNQETELAGSTAVNYGYTSAYSAAGATNGTAAKSTTAGSTAEITFTGDGIDIYANATASAGTVAVLLYGQNDNGTETLKKIYQVDTSALSGSSAATDNQAQNSDSLPIVSIQGLTHGTYRVVMMHTGAGDQLKDVYFDGFRVYNTLGDLNSSSYPTDEQNPEFLELRNAVLTGKNVTPSAVESIYETADGILSQVYENEGSSATLALLLGGQELDVQDLLDNGPKNELFLWPGESLTFNLGSAMAQVGLKAPMGETSYEITDIASGTIRTAADMFYGNEKMTGTVVIKNTGAKVLSVTKLKLFGATTLQPLTVEDVAYTLSVLGYTDGSEQLARPGAPIVNPFADVAEGSWYFDSVMWAVSNGITTGADATHFLPEALCQRAAVVTFLWRAAGCPEPETTVNPFVDVTEDTFYYKAVLWAVENGITTGVDAAHFAPYAACSRAQVVTFLWRANGMPAASAVNPFTDVVEGQWYTEAVLWAVENSITNGMSADIFGVDSTCNRAQIVTFLYRAAK